MISVSRCPHAGHFIVDCTSTRDPPRRPGRAVSAAHKNSASKARRARLFLARYKVRLYSCALGLKSSHLAASVDQAHLETRSYPGEKRSREQRSSGLGDPGRKTQGFSLWIESQGGTIF